MQVQAMVRSEWLKNKYWSFITNIRYKMNAPALSIFSKYNPDAIAMLDAIWGFLAGCSGYFYVVKGVHRCLPVIMILFFSGQPEIIRVIQSIPGLS